MPIFEIVSSAILVFGCIIVLRRDKIGKKDSFSRILFPIIGGVLLIVAARGLYIDGMADKKKENQSEIDWRQYEEIQKINAEYPEIRTQIRNSMDDDYISNAEFEQIKTAVERAKKYRVKSSLTKRER